MSRKTILPKQIIRRAYCIVGIFLFGYGFLIYRVSDIQLIKGEEYKEKLEQQNTNKIYLNSGKGTIYDRNNKPLTDNNKSKILIIDREKYFNDKETQELVENAVNINDVEDAKDINYEITAQFVQVEVENISMDIEKKLEQKGVIIEEKISRYSDNNLLSHVIGYSDNNGNQSGIEKNQSDTLDSENSKYISVFKAGESGGNIGNKFIGNLEGTLETVEDNEESKHVKITIDKDLQTIVEKIVDKEENPTAVVVSDIESGEILSMSSRPNFNQNSPGKYGYESLANKTTQVYQPASIFKIVVLYSALEQGLVDENYMYNCTGEEVVKNSDETVKCNNIQGHGMQTLQQAFSNSCNGAFVDIANKMENEDIVETAKKLHLGELVDIGIEEEKGNISEGVDSRNLPIGQGTLQVTPLQVNQMTQIIANNGTYKPLYLYDSIIDSNKNILTTFKTSKEEEIISPYIVTTIKEMMKDVSKNGTAKDLKELDGGSGVKTGTSEVRVSGNKTNNWWITGFYPENDPKYAITVLVEGTGDEEKDKSKSAVPIFKEICKSLNK